MKPDARSNFIFFTTRQLRRSRKLPQPRRGLYYRKPKNLSLFTNFLKGESDRTASRRTSRRHQFGARGQQSLLQRRSGNCYECGGVGHFLVTAPMFRRTNAAGGVQNRPAEDGRVHVVEPRAREALKVSSSRKHSAGVLKLRRGGSFAVVRLCGNVSQRQQKGGGDGRLYSESMS